MIADHGNKRSLWHCDACGASVTGDELVLPDERSIREELDARMQARAADAKQEMLHK